MFKQLRNTLTALAIIVGSTACAIVPAPYYSHHDRHVDVVSVRPAPYYAPAPGYYEPRHSDHGQRYRYDREERSQRDRD